MKTVNHKNREFSIIETKPASEFPHISAQRPNIEYFFWAVGKKGAMIDGFMLKDGSYIIF